MGEGERRPASRGEGDDGGNHDYKDGGTVLYSEDLMENSRKTDYLQWMVGAVFMAWCVLSSVPKTPSAAKPTDEHLQLHSSQAGRERGEGREVKMAARLELRSELPSPVSPQPPLSVLPQPVVFQSIGSQPSSHRACALPGL